MGREKAIGVEREAQTILEFCQAHGFSRATYYNLPREDRPREMIIGGLRRISREAAADWRCRMEEEGRREPVAG